MPCTAENNFVPEPPQAHADLIYLCFPNNPTGAVATREQLTRWVDYAHEHKALLLYDAAYEAYISDPEIPHSIYEIPGATRLRDRIPQLLENGWIHRCALRLHGNAESRDGADGRWPHHVAASALASALEHESEQRQLSGATRSRGALLRRREGAGEGVGRALHGQRGDPARSCRRKPVSKSTAERTRLTSGSRRRMA